MEIRRSGSRPSETALLDYFTRFFSVSAAVLALALASAEAHAQVTSGTASTKPNVVFILVDDVGWGDFSAYGGTVPTPRIDSIATDGLRLNNYTVEAQCTPSRSAIMTGRLPVRSGTTQAPLPGQGDYGLAPWAPENASICGRCRWTWGGCIARSSSRSEDSSRAWRNIPTSKQERISRVTSRVAH
jgi:hypothetical protein